MLGALDRLLTSYCYCKRGTVVSTSYICHPDAPTKELRWDVPSYVRVKGKEMHTQRCLMSSEAWKKKITVTDLRFSCPL